MNLSLRTVRPARLGAVAVLTCGGLVLAACSSGTATTAGGGGSATVAAKDVKLAYIVKFGTVPYFVEEARGVREKAKELGVTVSVQDVAQDSNAALSAVDTAIAQGVKGIAIVVPDQKIGPAVLQKAKAAGVAVVAIDDPIQAADGTAAPWVGFDSDQSGQQVGEAAVKTYEQLGWKDRTDVKIASIEQNTLSVCKQRTDGARKEFLAKTGFDASKIVSIPYDNSLDDAINKMGPAITANPDAKRWIIWSCNDEGVIGAGRALANAGVSKDNIIGAGLGGTDTACDEFAKGATSGLKSTVYFDSAKHGATAVQLLVDQITQGKAMPARTVIPGVPVDASSYTKFCS
jgi:L-arabinose transport system substrate-binding protein